MASVLSELGSQVSSLKSIVDRKIARRDMLQQREEEIELDLASIESDLNDHASAVLLIMRISQAYRRMSLEKVHALVTVALRGVFEQDFDFKFREEEKRGQVELTPVVVEDGEELDPIASMGGGVVDVLSVAFRPTFWSMSNPRTDPVMVLDEPGYFVNSERYVRNLGEMFSKLSKVLGLQFVIVTNRPLLASVADRIFEVTKSGRVSKVKVITT